jgi:hypothetical protein
VVKLADFVLHFGKIVPAIRRAREGDPVGNYPLGKQLERRMRQFLEGTGPVQPAMIAQPRAAKVFDAFAQPDPGIFFVLADLLLDHDRDEKLHRLETDTVHLLGDRQHRRGFHPESPETLLAVA